MEATMERTPRVHYCERCGDMGAKIVYVRTFAYDPRFGWEQIGGRVMRLLCQYCAQYFEVIESWALDGTPPVEADLELIDRRKATGRLFFDESYGTHGLWRMR